MCVYPPRQTVERCLQLLRGAQDHTVTDLFVSACWDCTRVAVHRRDYYHRPPALAGSTAEACLCSLHVGCCCWSTLRPCCGGLGCCGVHACCLVAAAEEMQNAENVDQVAVALSDLVV